MKLSVLKLDCLSIEQRLDSLEERMNILLLENVKLKLILEDICHDVSKEITHKPKKRR